MKVQFELNHSSNYPGCEGDRGAVIEIEKSIAEEMVSRKGGRILAEIKPKPKGKTNAKSSD